MNVENELKPDFIGIGTTKAATNWIFYCLKEHPEVSFVRSKYIKETKFFNRNYNYQKGIQFYKSLFKQCPKNSIKGEFTSDYILIPQTPHLIYKHFPDVKIIACLRDPVTKIYSEYYFQNNMRYQLSIHKTFEDALKKNRGLIESGYYYKQLKKYFELFPEKNILILFYEDIKKDPVEFIRKIYSFLDLNILDFIPSCINQEINVAGSLYTKSKIPIINSILYRIIIRLKKDSWFKILAKKIRVYDLLEKILNSNLKHLGSTKIKKNVPSYPPMSFKTKTILKQIYKEDIVELEKLLKKDLSFWK